MIPLSVTGRNLRSILLQTEVQDVRELKACHYEIKYRNVPRNEEFRVGFIKELIDLKNNQLDVPGFEIEEIGEILQHLCVS